MSQPSYFVDGINRKSVLIALNAWGVLVRLNCSVVPEWIGWPGQSVAARIRTEAGGADAGKGPELTIPELHYDRLRPRQHDLVEISKLVQALPYLQYLCCTMHYVHQLNRHDLASQIGATSKQVRNWLDQSTDSIATSLVATGKYQRSLALQENDVRFGSVTC